MLKTSNLAYFDIINEAYLSTIRKFINSLSEHENFINGQIINLAHGISVVFIESQGTFKSDEKFSFSSTLEAHRIYYDLHYTIFGKDNIVFKLLEECTNCIKEYDKLNDYILFKENSIQKLPVEMGEFCLIHPKFAHMALFENVEMVRKLVFKIPL